MRCACALGQDVLHQRGADPLTAVLGKQRDVNDPNLVLAPVKIQPADGLASAQDDPERGLCKLLLVERVLGPELHRQEGVFLGLRPVQDRQVLFSGTGVHLIEKRLIAIGYGTQNDGHASFP